MSTHREMIETLIGEVRETENLVDRIIKEAPDAGGAYARRLSRQVQDLSDDTGLPEEVPVEPGAGIARLLFELHNHSKAEGSIPRDVLSAADLSGEDARIPGFQQVQVHP